MDVAHGYANRKKQSGWAIWIAALAFLALLFFLSFFNRFAGLRSGDGEFVTGAWLLHGHLPYRDYFSATPPLNALKSALLLKIFGELLIVSRAAGVAERVLIAVVLFLWLARLFPKAFAFAGSLVTVILSAGDRTDPLASYNHDSLLWAIMSGYAASFVLDPLEDENPSRARWLLVSAASGLFAGLCLITKQTVGLGASVAVPFVVALLLINMRTPYRCGLWIAGFISGCSVPVAGLALWLHHLHLWRTFLTMAFLKGPAAKGGHAGDFLRRDVLVARDGWFFVVLALIAMVCGGRALLRSLKGVSSANDEAPISPRRLVIGFGTVILAAELLALTRLGAIHNASKVAVYFTFFSVSVLLIASGIRLVRAPLDFRQRQFALFAAVSFFSAFFLSLSWPAFEAMTLPGLGFLVAAVLDGALPRGRRVVYALLGIAVFLQVREKLDLPFAFEGLSEAPVREATAPSRLPALRGMRLAPEANAFLEGSVGTIHAHTTRVDTIFVYPEMSLFYPLADRFFPTLSGSHNVDVVNDAFASEEGTRLRGRPPAVIVYMPLTVAEVRREDDTWRFGKPSGQHTLVRAVEDLTATYRLDHSYAVGSTQRPIAVYVRP